VADLADLAGLDEPAGQAHGRDEAVVEGAHVLDARGLHALPGLVALVASRPSGFSQITCLPACAAAIVGSAWRLLGPELSNRPMRSSSSSARQSVTWPAKP
jgi:hypothetical protein